ALLELARRLQPQLAQSHQWTARLQLVAYDMEELGLIGSWYHAREIQSSQVKLKGMISLEMLGYTDSGPNSQNLPPMIAHLYPKVGNFIGVVGNQSSPML